MDAGHVGRGASRTNAGGFTVTCVGHAGRLAYTDYVFRVHHRGGWTWTVSRRYQELLDMHERLCAVFNAGSFPPFPPRNPQAGVSGYVNALFGQPLGTRPDVVAQREQHFQRYLDALCAREDVVRTALFQELFAVVPPEPVAHLKVRGWLPASKLGEGATALVDIRAEGTDGVSESGCVVDAFRISAHLVFTGVAVTQDELGLVAEFVIPSASSGEATVAKVPDLRPGSQVEIEVVAQNAVGTSSPVAIRLLVPESMASVSPALSSASAPIAAPAITPGGYPSAWRSPPESPRQRVESRQEMNHEVVLLAEQQAEAMHARQEVAEADLEERISQLRSLESRHEAALERSAEQQRRDQAGLRLEREELQQQTEEQRRATEAAEASCAARVKALEEQQELLERQRKEVVDSRLAEDAQRQEERLERIASERLELERSEAELRRETELAAHSSRRQAEELKKAEEELRLRADRVDKTEEALRRERGELARSRRNLSIVQAHVIGMIDGERQGETTTHRLDSIEFEGDENAEAEGENETAEPATPCQADKVWSMDDWTLGADVATTKREGRS